MESEDSCLLSPSDPNTTLDQTQRSRKGKHEQMSAACPSPASPAAVSAVSAGARKRSVRCKVCGPCRAEDCGTCDNCLDKPKFGGPNKKKQTCVNRKCVNMIPKTRSDTNAAAMTTTEDFSQLPLDDIQVDTREEHSPSSSPATAPPEDGPQTSGIIRFGSHGFFIPSSTGAEDGVMSDESFEHLVSIEDKANCLEVKVTEMTNEITNIGKRLPNHLRDGERF